MFKAIAGFFNMPAPSPADPIVWHPAPSPPLFKPYKDAEGKPLHTDHVMRRMRDGAWEYREMTHDEYVQKLFDQGAIM